MKRIEIWAVNYVDETNALRVKVEDSLEAIMQFARFPPPGVKIASKPWDCLTGETVVV